MNWIKQIFCSHDWKMLKTTYHPPVHFGDFEGPDALVNKVLNLRRGCTEVLLNCPKCGKLNITTMYGQIKE